MELMTSSVLSDMLDKALECPVCLEALDITARVLPCQHTFCRRCLLEIVHSHRQLLCPECRVECDLNVDDLPPNILLIRLLEGIKRKQSIDQNRSQTNDILTLGLPTGAHMRAGSGGQQSIVSQSMNQLLSSSAHMSQSTPQSKPNQTKSLPQTQPQYLVKQSFPTPVPNSLPIVKPMHSLEAKEQEIYVALFDYRPQKLDELELKKDELYSVSKKCYDGWYRGSSVRNSATGAFPGNYVRLVKPSVPVLQYPIPVTVSTTTGTSNMEDIPTTPLPPKEPPIPKPKPIILNKPAIGLPIVSSPSTTGPQNNEVIVYPRPRPTGQSFYPSSRNTAAIVPPPPITQKPARPLSSILVPNIKATNESKSAQSQLAQQLNQSLMISETQSVSQSALNQSSTQWHRPVVAATRNVHSLTTNSSAIHMSTSATAITAPPNVSVMSSIVQRPPTDRKETKPKEKTSNFIKRLTQSKPKRKLQINNNNNIHNNGSNDSISWDNHSFFDVSPQPNTSAPIHQRSGSCPIESLIDLGTHRKQSSFDDSNTVIKNRMCSPSSTPPTPQPIAPPLVRERFRCVVPYPPNSEYELELQVGDIVYVHKKRDDGWYKGTLQRTGKTGLFPGPFVESF